MNNAKDRSFIRAAIQDELQTMVDLLPSLRTGEGIISGEGVRIPSRVQFYKLSDAPKGSDPNISEKWSEEKTIELDTYKQLLHTQEWKTKRTEILEKHNYRCDWCGTTENLQVHHKKYLKYPNGQLVKPWEYDDDTFMCLCDNCHKKYHKKYKVKTYYRKY